MLKKIKNSSINLLTIKNLKINKTRNVLIIISISVVTMVIATTMNVGVSMVKTSDLREQKLIGTTAQAILNCPTQEQIANIKKLSYVKSIGYQIEVGEFNYTIDENLMVGKVASIDSEEWDNHKKPVVNNFEGIYPQKTNEIMASIQMLKHLGIDQPSLGMKIPLTYIQTDEKGDNQKKSAVFILTGMYEDYQQLDLEHSETIYVSEELGFKSLSNMNQKVSLYISFQKNYIIDSINMITKMIGMDFVGDNADRYIGLLASDIKMEKDQGIEEILRGTQYVYDSFSLFLGYFLIIFPVMICGFLLIYNCFYLTISKDIQQYGLLMAMGMTSKQLKAIVIRQGLILAGIGLLIGIALSLLASYIVVPMALKTTTISEMGIEIAWNPIAYMIATLFTVITTIVGAVQAATRASKITVIEAIRYIGVDMKRGYKKGDNGGKIYKIAWSNVTRNFKQTITLIFSLWLGIAAFLTVNTVILSMDTESFTQYTVGHDFVLYNDTLDDVSNLEIQNQTLNQETIEEIKSWKGVKDVHVIEIANIHVDYDEKAFSQQIDYYSKNNNLMSLDQEVLAKGYLDGTFIGIDTTYLNELSENQKSSIDMSNFKNGKSILISSNHPEFFSDMQTIGGSTCDTGNHFTFSIGGFVPLLFQNNEDGICPDIYIYNNVLEKLAKNPLIKRVDIDVNEKSLDEISMNLNKVVGEDQGISMNSKQQMKEEMRFAHIAFYTLGYILTAIIAMIGFLNFLNAMIINVEVRKKEFAIMRSIGMTLKQLKQMLMLEGIFYAIITGLLTVTVGNIVIYGVFKAFQSEAEYAIFRYPLIPLILAILITFLLLIFIPLFAYKPEENRSIVETLKIM